MKKPASFMVILRSDVSKQDLELLGPIVHTTRLESGLLANVLWCREVDSSGGVYAAVETKLTESDRFTSVQIPHWIILAIVGSKGSPSVGFVWAKESQSPPPAALPLPDGPQA